jgi:hypothetical protein
MKKGKNWWDLNPRMHELNRRNMLTPIFNGNKGYSHG